MTLSEGKTSDRTMLYRTLPANGDRLSSLGFGCMRLPQKDGGIDESRATRLLRTAIDRGVNYVDTAWPYHTGQSEPCLGRALGDGYRAQVKLATKLPTWMLRRREDMDEYLNAQLERLATDHIDYYLVHGLNGESWDRLAGLGVIEFLEKAKADGRIVNLGFSFHGALPDFKRIVDAYPWAFCQIQLNYLDETAQAGLEGLRYAAARRLGVMIMQPLRGGSLAQATPPPAVTAVWEQAAVRRTPAEWALRWVWNHPEVTVVLSGMNSEEQLEENLRIAATATPASLGVEELELVRRAGAAYRGIMKIGCTSCNYCQPCPKGVAVGDCFEVYNQMHMFGDADAAKFVYALRMSGLVTGHRGYASQCAACGECVPKCPQFLQIPELLEAVVAELEGPDQEEREALVRQVMAIG